MCNNTKENGSIQTSQFLLIIVANDLNVILP